MTITINGKDFEVSSSKEAIKEIKRIEKLQKKEQDKIDNAFTIAETKCYVNYAKILKNSINNPTYSLVHFLNFPETEMAFYLSKIDRLNHIIVRSSGEIIGYTTLLLDYSKEIYSIGREDNQICSMQIDYSRFGYLLMFKE